VSLNSKVGDLVHVSEFVNILSRKGFKVTLLIRDGKTPQKLRSKNLILLRIPSWHFPLSIFSYLASFVAITVTTAFRKPSLIYVRDTGVNIGIFMAKSMGIPVLLEVNGDLMKEYSKIGRVLLCLIGQLMDITYSSVDGAIIPSPNLTLLLVRHGTRREKIFCIPNGVNPTLFRPLDKTACRIKLGLSNSFYFCFVGHLAPWQGIDKALIGFSKFIAENSEINTRLLIVGNGPLRKKLEKLTHDLGLQDHILFLGSLPHELVPYLINACDVCIAPFTSWRNKEIGVSPLKLFEYLSCGKPVIASRIPGTEIIKDLDAGILVEPDNIEELKDSYKKAIDKLDYWEKRACALHKQIAINHSWDSRVNDIVEIIHRVNHAYGL